MCEPSLWKVVQVLMVHLDLKLMEPEYHQKKVKENEFKAKLAIVCAGKDLEFKTLTGALLLKAVLLVQIVS